MAPINTARAEKEKKLKALLNFAHSLPDRIKADPNDPTLSAELETHVNALPLTSPASSAPRHDELDAQGTSLWNLSTRLKRDDEGAPTPNGNLLSLLRVFAFLLLDSAQQLARSTPHNAIRLLKVALKAAKFCLDQKQVELCVKVLERAAYYEGECARPGGRISPEDGKVWEVEGGVSCAEDGFGKLWAAWKQNRLDLAEHMYLKAASVQELSDPSLAESLADLLYEMGKDQLAKKQYELAVRWLERAYDTLGAQDMDRLSSDAGELRLSIMHNLVRALLGLQTPEARSKAWDLVSLLETDYEDKMVVSLLKLELLSSEPQLDADKYYNVSMRMIRSIVLTQSNFKTIIHHIHKLKRASADLACKALDNLLSARLFESGKVEWIEKTVITRIWISTSAPESNETQESLQNMLERVSENVRKPFGAQAAHAAQTLLWKRIESAYAQGQYDIAEGWCRVAMHRLFEKCGEINRSKIARKMILCALGKQDIAAAREVFFQMSEAGKAAPMTRYLMYKAALRSADAELATECLDIVCRHSSKDVTLLYACVLEAQQTGDKRQAVAALQKVLEKYEYAAPQGVHLPALLRCTARLMMTELMSDNTINKRVSEELCKLFEGAVAQAKNSKRRKTGQDFTSAELEWFSRNSYNISLKHCTELHPTHLHRLLNSSIQFIELLQKSLPPDQTSSLALRRMFCDFLAACATITLARAEDNIERSSQHYLTARKHADAFRAALPAHLDTTSSLGAPARADLLSKHFTLLKFSLEATLKLEDWDGIDALFDACFEYEDPGHWDTLADLALVVHAAIVAAGVDANRRRKPVAVLQKLVGLAWRAGSLPLARLARWLRCLFQLCASLDESASLHCLEQAAEIARARRGVKDQFPAEELEWLAATGFNRAVDFYCAGDDASCRAWAEKAIALAREAGDGGRLHGVLQGKYLGLTWEK